MDMAFDTRQALIASASTQQTNEMNVDAQIKRLSDSLAAKRIRAINWLASTWVHHPDYFASLHQHHSPMHKHSVTLSKFLHERGAVEAGRV